jgi:dimethylaniline monooxygenase (N-oxide forming)
VQQFLQQNIFVMRVAVIGGGPSGLVTLKYLINAHQFLSGEPIEARLFESESAVGGTFKHRSYEDAEVFDPSSPTELKLVNEN